MADELGKIKVVTRATYDNPSYVKESDTVYFVIEGSSNSQAYLTLYVGTDKQTDIINIKDFETIGELSNPNNFPSNIVTIADKIYYIEDTDLNVFKAYMKSSTVNNELIPLYGTPVWESLD